MRINKLHLLWNMAALLLCASAASCSQDDMPDQGEQLPDGKYPLSLTATVGSPQTRSGGMDKWQGGEEIAVSIGDYTGKYTMKANGDATASDVPYYWQNTDKATVCAWYPYAEGLQTYDISDQSQGYAAFDFLYAEAEGSYAAPVQLTFYHQMAKVSYTLEKGDGITDKDLQGATVRIAGYTKVSFSEGKLAGTDNGLITPASDNEALLVPQNMTGKPLIKVSINGKDFIYTPDTETIGNLKAGCQYSYAITVKANGIEVTDATGEWTEGSSVDVVSKQIVTFYTADRLKIGDYVYSDGTTSDGGLRKLYSDGTIHVEEVQPIEGKECAGIIFHIRHSGSPEDESKYTEFQSEPATGYIVSLDQNKSSWCDSHINRDDQTPNNKINGYKYTSKYYAYYNASQNLRAINWCKGHEQINDSENLTYTLWYMPSQWEYKLMRADGTMQVLALIDANIQNASGEGFVNDYYFTVGLMGSKGNFIHMYNPKTGSDNAGYYANSVIYLFPYRAVCAFRAKAI